MRNSSSEKIQIIQKHRVNLSYIKESDFRINHNSKVERKEKGIGCAIWK